jgi:pimeloyl-ACP methyl ester carboxylesterase
MRQLSIRSLGPHGFHQVNYYEWGDPGNPRVLLCAHGLTRNARDFDTLAAALADRYRVVCPDIVGRGLSDWLPHKEDYAYPIYCADMAALIARTGANQLDWLGTSMGGMIGMALASQPGNPIRRLIVNDVGPFIPKASLDRIGVYVGMAPTFADFAEAEKYVRAVSAPFGPLTDAQWRHLTETSIKKEGEGYAFRYDPGIAANFRLVSGDVSLWPMWDAVACPTLILRGGESDLLPEQTAREMTSRGPKARVVEFSGIGHAPMLMSPDQIEAVRAFLEE